MKKIGLLAMAVMAVLFSGLAQQCLNNDTLAYEVNYTFATDTQAKNLTITKMKDCAYGCDNVTNTCAPSPTDLSMYYGLGIVGVMMIVGIAYKTMRGVI